MDTHLNEPITPPDKEGRPPGWIVFCLDCGFCVDAHGLDAEDAVKAVAPTHADGHHRLIARSVDYANHPLYPQRVDRRKEGPGAHSTVSQVRDE